jgi:carbamoyl-phosphate synthase large subunit
MPPTTPLTVLVTGVGGGGAGEQILKALRVADTPYRIVGGDVSAASTGLQKVDTPYLLPPASDPDYIDTVLAVCRTEGARAVFPGSEPELKVFSRERDRVRAAGLFLPINPAEVIDLCLDKVRTCEFLSARGFAVPAYRRVRSAAEAADFPHLPAVLKPSVGGGGSANVYVVQDRRDLEVVAGQLLGVHDEFIIQQYVGTPDQEYTVGVLTDMDGRLLHSIGVRRHILSALSNRVRVANRSGNADLGPVLAISSGVSQGVIGRFPDVTGPCEEIAKAVGSRGPLNVQCRVHGGRVYVMEINPRFSGTTSLRALVGFNEPDLLVRRHVLGEPVEPRFVYREGTIMRGLEETVIERQDFPRARDLLSSAKVA